MTRGGGAAGLASQKPARGGGGSGGGASNGAPSVTELYSSVSMTIPLHLVHDPRRITGQYPGRHVRLENRRIFRVLLETHFPLSVFIGKTGFGLLSARRDQRRRRHGRKDPISKNLEKSSTFCEKSFMHRHFPATSWLPTAPSCTPNNPPCTPGAPWVDSDRRRWDSAFFGFPSFPPTLGNQEIISESAPTLKQASSSFMFRVLFGNVRPLQVLLEHTELQQIGF